MPVLATPYLFLPRVVREVVEPGRLGAYALGNDEGGFVTHYVGRSDTCLMTRLSTHNHLYEFDYFIFRYAFDISEAFYLECEFWHAIKEGEADVRNIVHPAAPRGSGLECPYCHFARHVSDLLAPVA